MSAWLPWPAACGLNLEKDTVVSCTIRLPSYPDNSIGFIHSSQKFGAEPECVWQYSVVFPPLGKKRSKWTLVTGVNPSQLSPFSPHAQFENETPAPHPSLVSSARVADSEFHRPQAASTSNNSSKPGRLIQPHFWQHGVAGSMSQGLGFRRFKATAIYEDSPLHSEAVNAGRISLKKSKAAERPSSSAAIVAFRSNSICEHGKRKTICHTCGGGSLCVHQKQRNWCTLCGGKARCPHGKQRSKCVDCGGSGICEHGNLRSTCEWGCTKV